MATEEEIEDFAQSIGPYRRWYRFGWRSPKILFARLRNTYRPIFRLRMAWQRARRGYGEDDLWSINHTLAKLTVVGCRAMRESALGYPAEFSEEYAGEGAGGWEAWEDILRRIEEGFQAWLDEDGWFRDKPEQEAKFKDAMNLYAKWFSALWD